MRRSLALAAVLLLGACASAGGPGGGPVGARSRARPPLPASAQPTSVVATELAFMRAAREEGQWTAFRRYAASDAQMHENGVSGSAQTLLAGRANPATADRWVPRQAWSSCDGSAVLIVGTSMDAASNWSRFTRVWERQSLGNFQWVYSLSLPDAELTRLRQEDERERAELEALGENAIMVEAGNFIRAKVADCTHRPTPSDVPAPVANASGRAGISKDRTLRWEWTPSSAEPGTFAAFTWNGGEWEQVHSEVIAAGGE